MRFQPKCFEHPIPPTSKTVKHLPLNKGFINSQPSIKNNFVILVEIVARETCRGFKLQWAINRGSKAIPLFKLKRVKQAKH